MEFTAIIIAGGNSKRFGEDKGLFLWKNKSFIQHILDVIKPLTNKIIIVSNNPSYQQFGYKVVKDVYKDKGPLAGIYTGLFHSTTEKNVVLTCDAPLISEKLIVKLLTESDNYQLIYPNYKNNVFPLTSYYQLNTIEIIHNCLKQNQLKVKEIIPLLKSKELKLDDSFQKDLLNLNTKEDLKNWL